MMYRIILFLLGSLAIATQYGDNHARVRKDEPQIAVHFPDPAIPLLSPAFLKDSNIPAGFSEGTSGPTNDAVMEDFIQSLAERNDWMTYRPADYLSEEGRKIGFVSLSTTMRGDNMTYASPAQKATLWIQGGVHGNEPAGDQAVLALLGKMDANQTWTSSILENVDITILPRYNPDGVSYFQRTLTTNFDPNRDHIKLARQQTKDIKKTFNDFDPHVAVDMHEFTATFQLLSHGSVYIPAADVMFSAAKNLNIQPSIRNMSEELFAPAISSYLEASKFTWEPYVTLSNGRVPDATISYSEADTEARIGRNAMGLTQAIVFLVETRGVGIADQHFARRTAAGLTALESIIQTTADNAAEVIKVVEGGAKTFIDSKDEIVISDYPRKSTINWTFFDHKSGHHEEVPITFFNTTPTISNLTRSRPEAYLIPRAWSDLAERLRVYGLEVTVLKEPYRGNVEILTIETSKFAKSYDEGSVLATVTTNSTMKEVHLPTGSFWISTRQKNAGLAFAALEPEGKDSYVSTNIVPLEVGDEVPVYRVLST
ncbi:Carboxypeptidase 2 [Pseudocercospora fuligena]|uniref:Carboxypeptidase M14B n=1 Tax=Pseudocercospora fuligena TaxID=685502 RepID=A0A8H6VD39_9PEZI|nr:Carboxypeptidase 2 [Pseudocercospora fuligena]